MFTDNNINIIQKYKYLTTKRWKLRKKNKLDYLYLLCYPLEYDWIDIYIYILICDLIDNKFNLSEKDLDYKMYIFIKHLMEWIFYINKIVHVDINLNQKILYNWLKSNFGQRFKLIYFGLSDVYPFTKGHFVTIKFIPNAIKRYVYQKHIKLE